MAYTKRWKSIDRTSKQAGYIPFIGTNAALTTIFIDFCIFQSQRTRHAAISQRRICGVFTTGHTTEHPSGWLHKVFVTFQCWRRLSRVRWPFRFLRFGKTTFDIRTCKKEVLVLICWVFCHIIPVHRCIIGGGTKIESWSQRHLHQLVWWPASRKEIRSVG